MFAICNETFDELNWPHEKVFEFVAECGYDGVEIAPFTINPDATNISPAASTQLRDAADKAGIKICGLHWILTKTEGLNLTSADPDVRSRTSSYLATLARFCRDLGGDVMIFGSPNQRNRSDMMSMTEGFQNAAATLQETMPVLEDTGVTLAMEPLSAAETNFLLTAEDTIRLNKMIGSDYVRMMLDCKAMWAMEPESIPEVIHRYKNDFVHFHANDPNLQGPGFGNLDFAPILKALQDIKYDRWISVEVFDYSPGPEKLARDSIKYLKECKLQSASC